MPTAAVIRASMPTAAVISNNTSWVATKKGLLCRPFSYDLSFDVPHPTTHSPMI
jgi:hypothetical protein